MQHSKHTTLKYLLLCLVLAILCITIAMCKGSGTHPDIETEQITSDTSPTTAPTPTPILPMDGTGEANEGEVYDPEKIKEKLNEAQLSCTINACTYMEVSAPTYEGTLKYKNVNDFYTQISIVPYENNIADLSKAYFTSVVLAPGEEMNVVQLTKNLDGLREGQQPCLLACFCYQKSESGEYTYLGNCGLKLTLNVLSK